jgi:hypothetical protein
MNRHAISRMVAVLAGAVALFVLQQKFELQFYIAFPAAVVAYVAIRVGMERALGVKTPAR